MAWIVLALALGAYGYFFWGNFGGLKELAIRCPPGWRRRRYRWWIVKSWLLFAAPAVIGLALLGRLDALTAMPGEFSAIAIQAGFPIDLGSLVVELAAGIAAGMLIGGVWAWRRGRRGRRPAMLGDFSALLPADRAETWYAAGAAISAGITEELYFRLLVPLVVARTTGSAWAGFAAGLAMFGYAHRYQRWIGVTATTAVGALFAVIYLQSGQLWLAMIAHAGIDLNGLVLRPVLAARARRARGD